MSIIQSIPYPRTVAAFPNYATNESLAEQSTAGTSLTGAAISGTPTANTDYLFFWSEDVQTDNTASEAVADVTINGSSIFTALPSILPHEVVSPIDYQTMGGIFRYQAGASPSSTTFSLGAGRGTNPATLKCRNSRLSYVVLGPSDVYTQSIARQTFGDPGNKTAQTVATLSFTPPSAGDYTVIVSFNADMTQTTNVSFGMELTDGTTTTGETICRPPNTVDRCPTMLVLPLTGISGAKTISLKIRQTGTGTTTIGISEIRMVAIRNDRFASVHKTTQAANDSGTNTAYSSSLSQTFTPAAPADHLTVASWQMGCSNTSGSAFSQLLDGSDTIDEFIREYGTAVTTQGLGAVSHRIANYPASSRTQAIQRKSESASETSLVQKSAAIVSFELTGI